MRRIFFKRVATVAGLLLTATFFGCSTGRNYDTDRVSNTVPPQSGGGVKLPGIPNAGYDVGGVASAVANSPSYYKNMSVHGTIERVGKDENFGSPCVQCGYPLPCSVPGGEPDPPIRGQTDNSGKFSTLAKPDQMCEIAPISNRYKLHPRSPSRLTPGLQHSIQFLAEPSAKRKPQSNSRAK